MEVAEAPWMRPPVHVDAVVNAPEGHPIKAKLTGLTGTLAACSALMASTMLSVALPVEAVSGT